MVDAAAKPLVVVTGISGNLGSHVTKILLESGEYRLRGTVRNPNDESKVAPIRQGFGEELFSQMELVQADLMDEASLTAAMAGATFIVHVASPLPGSGASTEEEYCAPAKNGTLAVCRAAHANRVRRLVITSSIASC